MNHYDVININIQLVEQYSTNYHLHFLSHCALPWRTSGLCLFVKVHQATKVDAKLEQHRQHRIKVEDVG